MVLDIDDIITAGVSKEDIDKARESYVGFQHPQLLDSVLTKLRDDDSETLFALKVRKYLAEIEDINTRKHVLYELENKLRTENNYAIFNALNRYHYVLESCVYSKELQDEYNQHSKGDVIAYDTFLYYNYIGKDEPNSHSEFLCFSQALYHFSRDSSEFNFDASQLPVFVELFKNKFASSSIIEFCQSLLEAERFRRKVCQKKEIPPVTVKEFSIYLRQHCFNAYFDYRKSKEYEILLQNNDRPEAVTPRQAQLEVFRKENKVLKEAKEQEIDEDIWKLAYYFIWFVGKTLGIPVPEEREDFTSDEFQIPNKNNYKENNKDEKMNFFELEISDSKYNSSNKNNDIDRRIKAVYKAKVCKKNADWAAVYKLLIEEGVYTMIEYAPGATRINNACGKKVTTSRAIMQSAALEIIGGKWKEGGWFDRIHNKTSGNLLNRYMAIARAFYQ